MAKVDQSAAALHREWLRGLPGLTGKSLTAIAEDLGIAKTTLTRPLKPDDPGTSTLSATTIEKIVARYGVAPPGADPAHFTRPTSGMAEDAAPYAPASGGTLEKAIEVLTEGRAGIDPWVLRTDALELEGFFPGDIVLIDLNATPQPGDMVCAQVYDWKRMKGETIMRMLQRAAPVDLLLTRSRGGNEQAPLVVDGERVIIKGVLLKHRLRAA